MQSLQAGKLRQRVTLQNLVESVDTYGQPVQSWVDIATFSAEIRALRGQEILAIKQVWATASSIIKHRYMGLNIIPSPKQRYKMLRDDRIFNILDVNDIEERNRYYQCTCEEQVT